MFPAMISRLGLTQEKGSAREEGTVPLPGNVIVPILWNDFTKSKLQNSRKSSKSKWFNGNLN